MPKQAKQAVKQSRPGKISKEEEEDEDTDEIDRLTSSEAWLFPVIGSVTLCGERQARHWRVERTQGSPLLNGVVIFLHYSHALRSPPPRPLPCVQVSQQGDTPFRS